MNKRTRSPNYPAISLPDALERLTRLWDAIQHHSAPRNIVIEGMGYTSVNGSSLSALSALGKYGLLERNGAEFKITERGRMYLHPRGTERQEVVRLAAAEPKLFAELREQFPGGTSNDELIRNHLIRIGFTRSATTSAIRSFRETQALVERVCGDYDADSDESEEESAIIERQQPAAVSTQPGPPAPANVTEAAIPVQFRVSMTDEFRVDVTASGLYRSEVQRLIQWLQANEALVPEKHAPEGEQDTSNMN